MENANTTLEERLLRLDPVYALFLDMGAYDHLSEEGLVCVYDPVMGGGTFAVPEEAKILIGLALGQPLHALLYIQGDGRVEGGRLASLLWSVIEYLKIQLVPPEELPRLALMGEQKATALVGQKRNIFTAKCALKRLEELNQDDLKIQA